MRNVLSHARCDHTVTTGAMSSKTLFVARTQSIPCWEESILFLVAATPSAKVRPRSEDVHANALHFTQT